MRQIRVLIVDDDKDFAKSLGMLLERRGYEIELAYNGEDSIEKFRHKNFDLSFMDVKLPGKNGVESFFEIRKIKPEAKVVMMTGFSLEQLLNQAVENGAWGILHKPIDIKKMLEILQQLGSNCILIADDDTDFAESAKRLLESHGKVVLIARDGQEAVERIRSNGIDILILDLRMPILNGLGTYLELKKTGHTIPTIIVTGYADQEKETIETLKSMSVSGILIKPFDPKKLLEVVERLSKKELTL